MASEAADKIKFYVDDIVCGYENLLNYVSDLNLEPEALFETERLRKSFDEFLAPFLDDLFLLLDEETLIELKNI